MYTVKRKNTKSLEINSLLPPISNINYHDFKKQLSKFLKIEINELIINFYMSYYYFYLYVLLMLNDNFIL